jgi:hypothetical protein
MKPKLIYVGSVNDLERFLEREVNKQSEVTMNSYVYDYQNNA